jgi:hypothetical protein
MSGERRKERDKEGKPERQNDIEKNTTFYHETSKQYISNIYLIFKASKDGM